jgi:hypothetical protein
MNLFMTGDFTLRSGAKSNWKIECDALTPADWEGLAAMAAEVLPSFQEVEGVPRGGHPFEEALRPYAWKYHHGGDKGRGTLLFAEDVVTTGGSIERFRDERLETFARLGREDGKNYLPSKVIGVCVFARGKCPDWITPLFQMPLKGDRA